MDYELEKKVRFSKKTDSTLYSWCIDELSDKDKNHNKELIPYRFSTFFQVLSIRLVNRAGFRQRYSESGVFTESDNNVSIRADLKPSSRTKFDFYETSYSMFGTDRLIESMSLSIEKLDDDSMLETCNLWGSPSYKSDIDFREYIEPDHISVSIFLKSQSFESLVRMIESKSLGITQLILGHVDGFYSLWSPSISTSSIKVLTEYQKVEGEIDLEKPLPILGNVGEFSLCFSSKPLESEEKISINSKNDEDDEINTSLESLNNSYRNDESINAIESLKKPLWWILFALILLLLK